VSDRGTVRDTYAAAIRYDHVDVSDADLVLGVVRRPLPWFHGVIDENRSALGPPQALLDDYHDRVEALEAEGLDDGEAHRQAWTDLDVETRYRTYLREDESAAAAVASLRAELDAGTDVVLVCYENTDEKPCHRTILRSVLEAGGP